MVTGPTQLDVKLSGGVWARKGLRWDSQRTWSQMRWARKDRHLGMCSHSMMCFSTTDTFL